MTYSLAKRMLKDTPVEARLRSLWHLLYVNGRLTGERLKFAVKGRPSPSDAIIIAGSGRSGTTWLRDLMALIPKTQQVFEPLHPDYNRRARELVGVYTSGETHFSYYLPPGSTDPRWESLLEQMLTGRLRNYITDYERTSYLPDRYVIKLIRANLMLGLLHDRFKPYIIYLVRHPCAVVHSRLKNGWQADVKEILRQEELVEDHLRPWIGAIERETDLLGAHAVWWAVENYVAFNDLTNRRHALVQYEALCTNPEAELARLVQWLGLKDFAVTRDVIERPTRVSSRTKFTKGAVVQDWRTGLSSEDQGRIFAWAENMGISWYTPGTTV